MKLSMMLLLLVPLMSCHSGSTPDEKPSKKIEKNHVLLGAKSTYVATLKPINESVSIVTGAVTVDIEGDKFIVNVRANSSSPNTIHAQAIHMSSFCPTEVGDDNLDGYIDIQEAYPYTAEVLIPLDGDLNSQLSQEGFYPTTDAWGSYVYSQIGSYKALMTDLYLEDESSLDNLGKLPSGAPLNLHEKVVVIYGVSDSFVLPETVASLPGLSGNQTLPIACGTFTKIGTPPGTYEGDDVTVTQIGSTRPSNPSRPVTPGNPTSGNPHPTGPCPRDKICN